jgi:hypothetical protein
MKDVVRTKGKNMEETGKAEINEEAWEVNHPCKHRNKEE